MTTFFETMYRYLGVPFGWALTELYGVLGNYVIALVVFTLITRAFMIPANMQQRKSAARGQRLQPKIRRIQQKYAGNQQKIQQETQALYAREGAAGANMGCMSMLITMPIMYGIAGAVYYPLKYPLGLHQGLYKNLAIIETLEAAFAKLRELSPEFNSLVGNASIAGRQVSVLEHIQSLVMSPYLEVQEIMRDVPSAVIENVRAFGTQFEFLGINLGQRPEWTSASIIVPLASLIFTVAASVYSMVLQRRQNPSQQQQNLMMMGCMTLGMPAFMFYFTMMMPLAIGIYWGIGSFISLVQSVIFAHTLAPNKVLARLMVDDTVNRCAKEKELREKNKLRV
ncbi:MAG: YidC/Oxa1 family membrane protein insertase [Oscillospiraceae bacterium]|nr:YidC/Oxa1 family membrane protein insertase [Oscillospiraceae bacterium]